MLKLIWDTYPKLFIKMPKQKVENSFEYRKTFTNQFHLTQITILEKQWGTTRQDVCYRLITDGIKNEMQKRDTAETKKDIIAQLTPK